MQFFKTKTGIATTLLITAFFFGAFLFTDVFGGTKIGLTLNNNPDLENGLVAHWTFDGSLESRVTDRGSSGSHGYFYNPTQASTTFVSSGKMGQGLSMPGVTGNQVVTSFTPNYGPTDDFSYGIWFKTNSLDYSSDRGLLYGYGGTGVEDITLEIDGDGSKCPGDDNVIFYVIDGDPGTSDDTCTQKDISDKMWHHVMGTFNSADAVISLYLDGELASSTPVTANSSGTKNLHFSSGPFDGFLIGYSNNFDGIVDDARIYNRALSSDEVLRLYHLGATTKINKTITSNSGLERGLVGHWTFDGPDMDWGSTTAEVVDMSGNANNGNLANVTIDDSILGKIGQAIDFSASDDYVTVYAHASLDMNDTVSYSYWMKDNGTTCSYCGMLSKRDGVGGYSDQRHVTNDAIYIRIDTSAGTNQTTGLIYNIYDGDWHHITWVLNSGSRKGYRDGVLVVDNSYNHGTGLSSPLKNVGFPSSTFIGYFDDVRMYNRALSDDEVLRLYQLGATTYINTTITSNTDLETGLVGHWTFDGANMDISSTTAEVLDRSSSGNNGDWKNHATTTDIGKLGQAIYLDGGNDYVSIDGVADDSTGSFSMGAWINAPAIYTSTKFGSIIARNTSGGGNVVILAVGDNTGGAEDDNQLSVYDGGSESFEADSDTVVADGSWHHVFYTRNGASGILYADGIQVATHTVDYSLLSSDLVSIGQEYDGGTPSDLYKGVVDDVRYYSRELSASEVLRLYQLGN